MRSPGLGLVVTVIACGAPSPVVVTAPPKPGSPPAPVTPPADAATEPAPPVAVANAIAPECRGTAIDLRAVFRGHLCRARGRAAPAGPAPRIELVIATKPIQPGTTLEVEARLVNDSDAELVVDLLEPDGFGDQPLDLRILDLLGDSMTDAPTGGSLCGGLFGSTEPKGRPAAAFGLRIVLAPHGHASARGYVPAVGLKPRKEKPPCYEQAPLKAGRYQLEAVVKPLHIAGVPSTVRIPFDVTR